MCVEVCRQNYSCQISVLLMPKNAPNTVDDCKVVCHIYTVTVYIYGNLELENCGHTGGLRSWNSALGCRLQVQVPGRGSFSLVATFKLCS